MTAARAPSLAPSAPAPATVPNVRQLPLAELQARLGPELWVEVHCLAKRMGQPLTMKLIRDGGLIARAREPAEPPTLVRSFQHRRGAP